MVGVGGMPDFTGWKNQAVLAQKSIKAVCEGKECPGPQRVFRGRHPVSGVPASGGSQCQLLTGSKLDGNGQTDGKPALLSYCAG